MDEFIERRIVTGLIVSTEYARQIRPLWNPRFLTSSAARILAAWCLEYFDEYNQAPGKDIEGIYLSKAKSLNSIDSDDIAEILQSLSDEYDRGQFNVQYLLDETKNYFKQRRIELLTEQVQGSLKAGDLTQAESLLLSYKGEPEQESTWIDPFRSPDRVKAALEEKTEPLVRYGKGLGQFWNSQLVRDGFVAIMGREKVGKTWILLDIAMKANASGCNVVFFQAGDMTEKQFILRLCTYLTRKPYTEKYSGVVWLPTLDCKKNQLDTCDKAERECDFGILLDSDDVTYESLVKAAKENPDYSPCRNCRELEPAVWLKPVKTTALTYKDAVTAMRRWRKRFKKRFRLATYPNETLTVTEIRKLLELWEKQDGFVPDVIVIDYADLLAPDPNIVRLDFRNRQNAIWQRLRALSQEYHCLVVTATQAAASSYEKELLSLKDFSEDKRKYAHVTAMYGLNQTDEEKRIGVMRINKLVVREEEYTTDRVVHVLQRLQVGRPVLESYWPEHSD